MAGYLEWLRGLVTRFLDAGGDAEASGLADRARTHCTTLGREVRVDLPGGRVIEGTATGLDADARLVVRTTDGAELVVAAGDVTHARIAG